MFGPDQPVVLHLLDIEPAKDALQGVKMELTDAALPLLQGALGRWEGYAWGRGARGPA